MLELISLEHIAGLVSGGLDQGGRKRSKVCSDSFVCSTVKSSLVEFLVLLTPIKNALARVIERDHCLNEVVGALQAYLDRAKHLVRSNGFAYLRLWRTSLNIVARLSPLSFGRGLPARV